MNSTCRKIDGMSGFIYPIHLQEIREQSKRTSDPDLVADKVVYIDRQFIDQWNKKK